MYMYATLQSYLDLFIPWQKLQCRQRFIIIHTVAPHPHTLRNRITFVRNRRCSPLSCIIPYTRNFTCTQIFIVYFFFMCVCMSAIQENWFVRFEFLCRLCIKFDWGSMICVSGGQFVEAIKYKFSTTHLLNFNLYTKVLGRWVGGFQSGNLRVYAKRSFDNLICTYQIGRHKINN